ncbi:signal peptidase I SipW [Numidum massiliense]|uniref:signal peptidase I SipW n=1 Tax=Numidum massiliense TaxID=1522315 RepID=UPI0006D5661D|nr:signal peptidase I [Numidum massiliense]
MKAKGAKKWISRIATTVVVVVLLLMILMTVSTVTAGGPLNPLGYELFVVLSGSMEPSMQTGSVILVKHTDAEQQPYKKGDIITFRAEGQTLITHRVQEVERDGDSYKYITKGDNNDAIDPNPVHPEQVVGHFSGVHIPYLGHVLAFARSKAGIALLLIIPGLYLIVTQIVSLLRLKEKEKSAHESAD